MGEKKNIPISSTYVFRINYMNPVYYIFPILFLCEIFSHTLKTCLKQFINYLVNYILLIFIVGLFSVKKKKIINQGRYLHDNFSFSFFFFFFGGGARNLVYIYIYIYIRYL